jgi:hypothetical protein
VIRLSSRVNAPAEARLFAERFSARYDLESRSNVALVVSELVTRTVVAGDGSEVALRLGTADDGILRGEIEGPGTIALDGLSTTPEGTVSARIIDHLTLDWGVDAELGSAWFEVRVTADP